MLTCICFGIYPQTVGYPKIW